MSVRVWKGRFMLIYIYVRILVPMSYSKLWNYIHIYIYIPSVRPSRCVPSRRRRRRASLCCPSVRPDVRPSVVVRPLSVRPVMSRRRRRRPLSVRPSRRLFRRRRPSSVRPSTVHVRPSPSSGFCPSVPSSVPSTVPSALKTKFCMNIPKS